MATISHRSNRPRWANLHPAVYFTLIACALAMAVGVWLFAVGGPHYGLVFAVVGFFAVVAIVIPSVLARFTQRRETFRHGSLGEWTHGELEIYDHQRISAPSALTMILIGPLSGAIGLAAIGLIAIVLGI